VTINTQNIADFNITDYLGRELPCECGRVHGVNIERVIIEKGALESIPEILRDFDYEKVLLAADANTYKAAGERVENLLKGAGFPYGKLVYERPGDLVPDERAIGEMAAKVEEDTDAIVAVGSGVLNDLAKYVGHKLDIPCIIVATAPSMDGYASDTSALILENLKTSCPVAPPRAIIADTEILKNAPMVMILAGLGDMLGKYNALKDWKLGNLILDEYYCPAVAKMVEIALENCVDSIDGFCQRDDTAVKNLMEGLVLTGIAMSFVGNSRPASGSEHHLSHFWEMMFLLQGKPAVLHGTKVGITTLATGKIAHLLNTEDIDFDEIEKRAQAFDEDRWAADIERIYDKSAPGILKLSRQGNRNSLEEKEKRRAFIRDHWEAIVAILKEGPSVANLEDLLQRAGAPMNPKQIGVDEKIVFEGMLYAKEIRPRYTVLQLLWDIDLLEEYARLILKYYFEEQKPHG
jgi:glycerol-1-phosphate dehydrogenase [NAD(P)+]